MPSYLFWASVNFFLHLSQGDFKVKYDRPRCLWSVSFTRNEPQLALQLVKVCHLKPSHLHLKLRNWTKFFVHVHEIFSSIFYIFRIKFWAGIYLDFVFEHRRRPDWNEIQLSTRSKMFQLREVFKMIRRFFQSMREHFLVYGDIFFRISILKTTLIC